MPEPDAIYVVTVDYEQALATTTEQVRTLIEEKFNARLAEALAKPAECGAERNIHFNAAITRHATGVTGWTKARR